MKRAIELFVSGVVVSVGIELGTWLWEDTLEGKFVDFKKRWKESFQK